MRRGSCGSAAPIIRGTPHRLTVDGCTDGAWNTALIRVQYAWYGFLLSYISNFNFTIAGFAHTHISYGNKQSYDRVPSVYDFALVFNLKKLLTASLSQFLGALILLLRDAIQHLHEWRQAATTNFQLVTE